MALQTISQPFKSRSDIGNLVNTIDSTSIVGAGGLPANTSQYTNGTTIIDQPSLQIVGRHWKLLSVAFRATLFLGGGFRSAYGRLGRIYAGVDPKGALNPSSQLQASFASIPPWQDLPFDSTLVTPLWDPAIDPLPSDAVTAGTAASPGLQATATIGLPTPLSLHDAPISVGLWVTRSLLGCPVIMPQFTTLQGIVVNSASYALNFDDGT